MPFLNTPPDRMGASLLSFCVQSVSSLCSSVSKKDRGSTAKQSFLHLANHRIRRVEDVPHVVAHALPEQDVRSDRIEAVIILEPADHLGRRVLHALIERPRIAYGEDEFLVLPTRPTALLSLQQPDGEEDIERNLDPCPDDLTVPLQRVTIADVQQRAGTN